MCQPTRRAAYAALFFYVHDGVDVVDQAGTELPDLAAARVEAVRLAGRMLSDDAEKFWTSSRELQVTVRGADGHLFTILTSVR